MPERPSLHAWCRANALAHAAGLLADVDDERFRAHLASCPACREALNPMFDEPGQPPASPEHIPPDLLARWDHARRSLRGLSRALVRAHLEGCAECRQDLEALGHAPVLPVEPELESVDAEAILGEREDPDAREPEDASAAAAPTAGPRPQVAIRMVRATRTRAPGWLTGWAVAASLVAVAALVVRPAPAPRPAPAAGPARPAPTPAAVGFMLVPEPVTLSPPLRGAESIGPVAKLEPGARTLALRPPVLDQPDWAKVRMELVDGQGRVFAAREFRQSELHPPRTLAFTAAEPLAAGAWALRIVADPGGGAPSDTLVLPFSVGAR